MTSNGLLSRRTAVGAGLALALVAGGIGATVALDDADATPLRQQADDLIPIAEALRIAGEEAGGEPHDIELEREADGFVYEIEVGASEVKIDGQSGDVLDVVQDDDDDGDDDGDDEADEREEALDLPVDAIEPSDAIAAAESEAGGQADEIEIERRDGQLVYSVEVGETEVFIDLATGAVVGTEQDD